VTTLALPSALTPLYQSSPRHDGRRFASLDAASLDFSRGQHLLRMSRVGVEGRKGSDALERFPFERNRSNDKKSLKIKMLEQALIEKVYQLFRSLL